MRLQHIVGRWPLVGLLLCVCMVGSLPALAQMPANVPVPPLSGHVVDLTQTLSSEQQKKIDLALAAFEQRKGSQLAVLIVPTTQPETIEQYALRVAEQWKLGRQKIDDGAILLVAKSDRSVRIEVGYGLEGALNDATCKRIIEEIISPNFRQGDFEGGISAGMRRIMRVIDGEPLPAPAMGSSTDPYANITWIIVAGALLGFVLRAILGRLPGTLMTAAIVGTVTWFLLGVLSMALIASGITLLSTWIGLAGLLRARFGRGGPGGGFRGGGGGFGGGGASGSPQRHACTAVRCGTDGQMAVDIRCFPHRSRSAMPSIDHPHRSRP